MSLAEKTSPKNVAFCAECGREFEANKENSAEMKVMGLYATVCKSCYLKLKRQKKIRVLKKGEEGALI